MTLIGPAFTDRVLADLAAIWCGEPLPGAGPPAIELFVVGAHRSGQPLNGELTARGARFLDTVNTTADYRLHALETTPAKPGLVRVREGGAAIEGELWALPAGALGPFLAALPAPMTLGQVQLEGRRSVVGFTCEGIALDGAADITAHGSWPAYLAAR